MRKLNFIPGALFLILLSGCYASYYHPVSHLPPAFEKEGDLQLNLGIGSSEIYPQFNLQSTYAFDSAQFSSFSLFLPFPSNGAPRSGIYKPRSYYIDAGYGRQLHRSKSFNFFLQGTASYGKISISKTDYFFEDVIEKRNLDYVKFNFIPTASWNGEIIDIGINAKSGVAYFMAVHENLPPNNPSSRFHLEGIKANRLMLDFQPSIFAAVGVKKFKLIAQYSLLFPNERISHDFIYASVGLKYFMNTKESFHRKSKMESK